MPIVSKNQNEFMAGLDAALAEPAAPETNAPAGDISLLPASAEALQKTAAQTEAARVARPQTTPWSPGASDLFTKLGGRPGIHFDIESGVPFFSRLAAEREPTEEERIGALQHEYGKENVRLNAFGRPVVTTTDEKGKTMDLLVDPIGLDKGDLATFLAQTPELAGSIVPLILTRGATMGPGVLKALATLGMTTGGAEMAGGLKDMYRRWMEGRDVEPGEVAARRAVSGTAGLITGGAMGAAGKLSNLVSPFNSAGRLQFNATEAVNYFKDKYARELSQTAGQKSGSQILMAIEAMEAQKPGSRTAFSRFRQRQLDQISELRRIATGEIPDTEEAGKRVTTTLKAKLAPLEFDIQEAAATAERQAADAIKAGIGTPIDKVKIGQAVDLGAKFRKSAFDMVNERNYGEFYDNPLSTQKIVGGAPLKQAVDELIADLPSIEKTIMKPVVGVSGKPLTDAAGAPLMRAQISNIPITTPVRERLVEISQKLEGGRLSINDLKSIRTDVDNAIKTGEAVPGVKEGRLKAYYSALTDAIEQGLDDIGDPQLKAAWQKAAGYYKANVGKFERAGIAELFRDPINAMGPTELVERARKSPDIYAAYKEFFGPSSPQLKGIHQAAKDDVLQLGQLGKTVDAAEFVRRIESLDQNSPQLLVDAFGRKQAEALRTQANIMLAAQGKQLPKDELNRALSSGTLSGDSLREMLTAQARRDDAYANSLIKEIASGNVKPDKIKPTEVVDKLVFRKETQPADLKGLVDQIINRPDTLEDLRRLTFKKTLDDATVTDKSANRVLSGVKLNEMLSDENLSKKLQTVLGPDSYEDLVRFRDFLLSGEVAQGAFPSAGGIAGGMQIQGMVERGELKYVNRAIKNFLLATVYTSEPIKNLLTNQVFDREAVAMRVNMAIASAPFIRAVLSTYKKEAANALMTDLKGAVDQMVMRNPATARSPGATRGTEGIPWGELMPKVRSRNQAEFLQGLDAIAPDNAAPTPTR